MSFGNMDTCNHCHNKNTIKQKNMLNNYFKLYLYIYSLIYESTSHIHYSYIFLVFIHTYIHTHTHTHIYIYIYSMLSRCPKFKELKRSLISQVLEYLISRKTKKLWMFTIFNKKTMNYVGVLKKINQNR